MIILLIQSILLWLEFRGATSPVSTLDFIPNGEVLSNMHWNWHEIPSKESSCKCGTYNRIVVRRTYLDIYYCDKKFCFMAVPLPETNSYALSVDVPLPDTNVHALPRDLSTYHGQSTVIIHKKEVKKKKGFITQQFRFKIEVIDGLIYVFIQKDGQRSNKAKSYSEIRALTKRVIRLFLVWMGFVDDMFDDGKMSKPQIVEFMCEVFHIPTKKTLEFQDDEVYFMVQYLIEMHSDMHEQYLVDYIQANHTNMHIIAEILILCQEKKIDIRNYLSVLWIGLLDNFEVNKNYDDEYRKGFDLLTESEPIIKLQTTFTEDVATILHEYNTNNNTCIKHILFWYSIDLSLFRLFNYSAKQCILSNYVTVPLIEEGAISEQMKCTIWKFFGSALYSCETLYKSNIYGATKSKDLAMIAKKCLVNYDAQDFEDGKCSDDHEYMQVPLRLRLENRGHLRLIMDSFFQDVAVKMYLKIANDLSAVFACYDPKKIKKIEEKMLDDALYETFVKYVGSGSFVNDNAGVAYKNLIKRTVWKDLIHKVTSRLVLSIQKRSKVHNNHVGQFRTAIKAKQSQT